MNEINKEIERRKVSFENEFNHFVYEDFLWWDYIPEVYKKVLCQKIHIQKSNNTIRKGFHINRTILNEVIDLMGEIDEVDFVQRNFDARASNNTRLKNDALRGEYEMRAIPLQCLSCQVDDGERGKCLGNDEGEVFEEIVWNFIVVSNGCHCGHQHQAWFHEPPPMWVQIEHQHFVVVEVFH